VFATDISNNDTKFPHSENEYIHKEIMGDYFEWWDKFDKEGSLIGTYIDQTGVNRYYEIKNETSILLSGEGLTSIVNKTKHTTMQLYNHCRLYYGIDINSELTIDDLVAKDTELKFDLPKPNPSTFVKDNQSGTPLSTLTQFSYFLQNNGDDTLDGFSSSHIMNEFKKIALENPFADVGEEPPSFSGIGILVDENGKMKTTYSLMKSLFIKGLETERRNWDSNLGYLPYNSVKGKIDFMMKYSYDDNLYLEACDLYSNLRGIDCDYVELQKRATVELQQAEKSNDRQYFINRMKDKLGEDDPSKLYYKYTTEDLMRADPIAFEELFIHRPISKLLSFDKMCQPK
jgi:hypothetical protein